jgi:hypothetical protein
LTTSDYRNAERLRDSRPQLMLLVTMAGLPDTGRDPADVAAFFRILNLSQRPEAIALLARDLSNEPSLFVG